MNAERPCSKCGIPKPPDGFYARLGRRSGRQSQCKKCANRERCKQERRQAERRLEALDWRTTIDPVSPKPKRSPPAYRSPEERFWEKTEPGDDGCIVWIGSKRPWRDRPDKLYGQFGLRHRPVPAHRYAYSIAYGSIPPGFEVHHVCLNTLRVNPEHLEALTREAHVRVSGHARKTHCPQGHPYDDQNTYWHRGHRLCRTCLAVNGKATKARARAKRQQAKEQAHSALNNEVSP